MTSNDSPNLDQERRRDFMTDSFDNHEPGSPCGASYLYRKASGNTMAFAK